MWENILQKGRRISKFAIKLIEEVMDSEPRTINEILDLMYIEMENKQRRAGDTFSRRRFIPTRNELIYYLSKNYNSGFFDKYTNAQLPRRTTHSVKKYWK